MRWAPEFYRRQGEWTSAYIGPAEARHRERLLELLGEGEARVLELGAGGGQHAFATAQLGHRVWAVEQSPEAAAHCRQLSDQLPPGRMQVLEGDFYELEPPGPFDRVTYWDGFGIGSDADQRRLLRRIAGWLTPGGSALIDFYSPIYAARSAGREMQFGRARRRYGYDPEGCRWLDSWWLLDREEEAVTQSLRAYTPADLRLLLEGCGLELLRVRPGGGMDWEQGRWCERLPLADCMSWCGELALAGEHRDR